MLERRSRTLKEKKGVDDGREKEFRDNGKRGDDDD